MGDKKDIAYLNDLNGFASAADLADLEDAVSSLAEDVGSLDADKQDKINNLAAIEAGAAAGATAVQPSALTSKADVEALDEEYDPDSDEGYEPGDTCTHNCRWYICTTRVAAGSDWDPEKWRERTVKDVLGSVARQNQADWDETDALSPAYILNKPAIPALDGTLTEQGEAADAKAVGDRIAQISGGFAVASVVPGSSGSLIELSLQDRTVNVADVTVPAGKTVSITIPQKGSGQREFYLSVRTDVDATISAGGATLEDSRGGSVTISAAANRWYTYKFIEVTSSGNVFTVTGACDPAYEMASEIERALDEILGLSQQEEQ